jgi:hypothetical protein
VVRRWPELFLLAKSRHFDAVGWEPFTASEEDNLALWPQTLLDIRAFSPFRMSKVPTNILVQKPIAYCTPGTGRCHRKDMAFRAPFSARNNPSQPYNIGGKKY